MRCDHRHLGWMTQDPDLWSQDENYMKLLTGVKNFTVVNDPSERIVQLAEKRIKTVRSELRFQQTVLSVHELNLLCHGIKRGSRSATQNLAQTRKGKKTLGKEKKTPGKDFNKSA